MPELPEVQAVVNHYKPILIDKTIQSINHLNDFRKVFETHSTEHLNDQLTGEIINDISRRGKYIIITTSKGYLCIHLRMTGQLQLNETPNDNHKHFTALITLTDKSKIYFKDYRKFGRIYFFKNLDFLNAKLGPEPLSINFTYKFLRKELKKSKGRIKPKLLNQKFIAGLGNIYVDEVLWKSKIHPLKASNEISGIKIKRLHKAIPEILEKSINFNGTTIINFSPGNKTKGKFAEYLNVFGKQGSNCPNCKTTIKKIFVGQRGTHYCPNCQKV